MSHSSGRVLVAVLFVCLWCAVMWAGAGRGGGSIKGSVSVQGGGPLAAGKVQAYDTAGEFVVGVDVDGSGNYALADLLPGTYYLAYTPPDGSAYVSVLHQTNPDPTAGNNLCPKDCGVTAGTPIEVVPDSVIEAANFLTRAGGDLNVFIRAQSTSAPLAFVPVQIFGPTGQQIASKTTESGTGKVTFTGLMPGTYFVRTAGTWTALEGSNWINQLYENKYPALGDTDVTTGTPVTVTWDQPASITQDLPEGTYVNIQTQDTSGAPVSTQVQYYNSEGAMVGSGPVFGSRRSPAFPPGDIYVRTYNYSGLLDVLYDNRPCAPSCTPTQGDPVHFPQSPPGVLDLGLPPGSMIGGNVTFVPITTLPLEHAPVTVFDAQQQPVQTTTSLDDGSWMINRGLPQGTYYAKVEPKGYRQQVYNGVDCPMGTCNVTSVGTPIVVGATPTTITGVNFNVQVCPPIQVMPNERLIATRGAHYHKEFYATGGDFPYSFSVVGDLPHGLESSEDRMEQVLNVYGYVTSGWGSVSFEVRAVDNNGCTGSRRYTMLINDGELEPPPTITSVTPASGAEAIVVTIAGDGFDDSAAVLFYDSSRPTGVPVPILQRLGLTVIVVQVPRYIIDPPHPDALATYPVVNVRVTNSDSQYATLENGFTYETGLAITGVTPAEGLRTGGTAVTISGTEFSAGAKVYFDAQLASSIVVVNATTITAKTPAHDPGQVGVKVVNPDKKEATLGNAFTYLDLPPDLMIQRLVVPPGASPGQTIVVTDATRNAGKGAALASATAFYLSADAIVNGARPRGAADWRLFGRAVGALKPRALDTAASDVLIPTDVPPGSYLLIARADDEAVINETSETNNTKSRPITIGPDLMVKSLAAPASALPGAVITVKVGTRNAALGPAPVSSTRVYWSTDPVWDAGDTELVALPVGPLAGRASTVGAAPLTVPADATKGQVYYLVARADAGGTVAELEEGNNARAKALRVK